MALGKEFFADEFFAECSLPSVALGKAFAECKAGFAECGLHSAKNQNHVVIPVTNLEATAGAFMPIWRL